MTENIGLSCGTTAPCVLLSEAERGRVRRPAWKMAQDVFPSVIMSKIYFIEEWCRNKCNLPNGHFALLCSFWGYFGASRLHSLVLFNGLFHWRPERSQTDTHVVSQYEGYCTVCVCVCVCVCVYSFIHAEALCWRSKTPAFSSSWGGTGLWKWKRCQNLLQPQLNCVHCVYCTVPAKVWCVCTVERAFYVS